MRIDSSFYRFETENTRVEPFPFTRSLRGSDGPSAERLSASSNTAFPISETGTTTREKRRRLAGVKIS